MLLYSTAKASNNDALQITHTGYAIDTYTHSITIILCLHVSARVKIASPEMPVSISNHLVRFAIQLISNTRTNRDYSMVCISVYGRRGSFFNISCTKTLFCPEISLVRSDSHSLTLPLSSDTSEVAFHSVQHSAFSL